MPSFKNGKMMLSTIDMKEFTDTELLDWLEKQTNGDNWVARESSTGRGFRLHNILPAQESATYKTAREAIAAKMRNEYNS